MIRRVCLCGHGRVWHQHDTRPGDTACSDGYEITQANEITQALASALGVGPCPCPRWRWRGRWERR